MHSYCSASSSIQVTRGGAVVAAVPELDHTVAAGGVQPQITGGEEDGRDAVAVSRAETASHVPR